MLAPAIPSQSDTPNAINGTPVKTPAESTNSATVSPTEPEKIKLNICIPDAVLRLCLSDAKLSF